MGCIKRICTIKTQIIRFWYVLPKTVKPIRMHLAYLSCIHSMFFLTFFFFAGCDYSLSAFCTMLRKKNISYTVSKIKNKNLIETKSCIFSLQRDRMRVENSVVQTEQHRRKQKHRSWNDKASNNIEDHKKKTWYKNGWARSLTENFGRVCA